MDLYQTQLELEQDMVDMGVQRYKDALEKDISKGREFDHSTAQHVMLKRWVAVRAAMEKLQASSDAKLKEGYTSGRRLAGWELPVSSMDTDKLTFIALKCAVCVAAREMNLQAACSYTGRMLYLELFWDELKRRESAAAKERGYAPPNRVQLMKRNVKEVNPKSLRKWLKKFDDLTSDMDFASSVKRSDALRVGTTVFGTLMEEVPGMVYVDVVKTAGNWSNAIKVVQSLRLTPEFADEVQEAHQAQALRKPWLLPMVVPPVKWESDGTYMRAGGYLKKRTSFLRKSYMRHTTIECLSPTVIAAVNAVQETAWQVCPFVLTLAEDSIAENRGPLPYEPELEMPENVPQDEWDAMDRAQRGAVKAQRERVHSHNKKSMAKRMSADRVVSTAQDMSEYNRIYFPHSIDWRGRMYPNPQDMHPQADDFGRSILKFAEGKRLGASGLRWLKYHLANTYGKDKLKRLDQEMWVALNHDMLMACASYPWDYEDFWCKAEEPWQFIAAAREYMSAMEHPEGPEQFISHLPISIDGSCNGLQHLSAMGLDPIGGSAVNLLPGPRQDIYQIVADKVDVAIEEDCALLEQSNGYSPAYHWQGKVSRKVVKRGVMTTPYGLTSMGMRDQLLKDGFCDDLEGDRMANANYLRDRMLEAISGTLVKGTETMKWMQGWARRLAEEGKPIEWTTPVGFRVKQAYYHMNVTRKNTLLGKLSVADGHTDELRLNKQVQSVAPNIVHSFDAAHLMMTVQAMGEGHSFAMVHDSFGTHACDVDKLLRHTKEQFVKVYSHNWFEDLDFDFHAQLGEATDVPTPERGHLDINDVLESDYFFA
jgi:DNA-directed RNA polymerase